MRSENPEKKNPKSVFPELVVLSKWSSFWFCFNRVVNSGLKRPACFVKMAQIHANGFGTFFQVKLF